VGLGVNQFLLTTTFTANAVHALSVASAVAAVAIFLLGAGALVRSGRRVVGLLFFLVTLTAAGWLGCFAMMYSAADAAAALNWARRGYFFGALLPAAVFLFATAITDRRRQYAPMALFFWLACAAVGATGLFTSLLIPSVRRVSWGYYPVGPPQGGLIVVFFATILFASIHLFWRSYRAAEGSARERAGALLLAFVLGSMGMFDVLPSAGIELQPIGYVAALAFVIVAATAVWRFEVSDITPEFAAGQILDTMKSAVIVSDMQGKIRVVNRGAERLLGYASKQLKGVHLRNILSTQDQLSTGQLIGSIGVLEHPMIWRGADDVSVPVLVVSSFLRDDYGTAVGVVYVANDFTERKRAEEALQRSEERYRELFENANDLVYTHDLDGRITSVNLAGEKVSGYSRQELLGKPIQQLLRPEQTDQAREALERKLRGEASSTFYEVEMVAKDGRKVPLELSTRLIRRDGKADGVQGIARDITERKASEARYRLLFERNLAGVYRIGTDGRIIECNESCARIFGYESRQEFLQTNASTFHFEPSEWQRMVQLLREQHQLSNFEQRLRRRDGSAVWVLENITLLDGNTLEGAIIDITDRKHAQEQLEHQAYHDALTGLPNRLLFRDRVGVALAHARRSNRKSAVMFLDLDEFKLVNDRLGHTAGDRLLQVIGWRLGQCVRAEDTVARMGGDEFTILLSDLADQTGAEAAARKFMDAVRQPVAIDEHELIVSTSLGIAMFPADGGDAETLLKAADAAMYRAKEMGRDKFAFASRMPAGIKTPSRPKPQEPPEGH
jgi:diguanylate cyclase (GGDEF)-like protein/PAS domain S-box-containing protein